MQPISQATFDLNNEQFNDQTGLDHLFAELVCNSDPHSTSKNVAHHDIIKKLFAGRVCCMCMYVCVYSVLLSNNSAFIMRMIM